MTSNYLCEKYGDDAILLGFFGTVLDVPKCVNGKKIVAVGQVYYENKNDVLQSKAVSNGKRLFSYEQTEKLTIHENVTLVRCYSFYGNRNLKFASVSGKNTLLENGVFMECNKLKEAVIDVECTKIPTDFFKQCSSLKKVFLNNKISEIGVSSFEKCVNLNSIDISNITVLGRRAFFGCMSLNEIKIAAKEIGAMAFAECGMLEKVSLCGCKKIGADIFKGCGNLSVLEMQNGLNIGKIIESINKKILLIIKYDDGVFKCTVNLNDPDIKKCFVKNNFNIDMFDKISASQNDTSTALSRLKNKYGLCENAADNYKKCIQKNYKDALENVDSIEKLKFICENVNAVNAENISYALNRFSNNLEMRTYLLDFGKTFSRTKYKL